jgi:hypothetical protein
MFVYRQGRGGNKDDQQGGFNQFPLHFKLKQRGNAMFDRVRAALSRWIIKFITVELKGFEPSSTTDPIKLAAALKPGDVLLVEGNTRVSAAIKYLTQSTWSHSALYVGTFEDRSEPDGEPHVLIEVDVELGCISIPLSRYAKAHTRICRPVGLDSADIARVCTFMRERVGVQYDLRNVFDLARYLFPTIPVPVRWRRRMIALGSGDPSRAICSTLIARAFQSVRYPVLPRVARLGDTNSPIRSRRQQREILHIRHHSLYTPRDFDLSPYFGIIKPTIEAGFDYRQFMWGEAGADIIGERRQAEYEDVRSHPQTAPEDKRIPHG